MPGSLRIGHLLGIPLQINVSWLLIFALVTYLLMAGAIDKAEADARLDFFLDLEAKLIREPNPLPMLH